MSVSILPSGKSQYFDLKGVPLSGGKLWTYEANTSTPKTTYSDPAGAVPNTNPVILDGRGEAQVYGTGSYKLSLLDKNDNPVWSIPEVPSLADASAVSSIRSDLADTSSASKGAGMVGIDPDLDYSDNTVGLFVIKRGGPVNALRAFTKAEAAAIQAKTSTSSHQAQLVDLLQNERAVWFPFGKYNANAAINLGTHNVSIYGHRDALIEVTDGNFIFLHYTGAAHFSVRDVQIFGTEHTNPLVTLLQCDTGSSYFDVTHAQVAYAKTCVVIDGCYIATLDDLNYSNARTYLKFAGTTGSTGATSAVNQVFGTSTIGTESLVQVSVPEVWIHGQWETQYQGKRSLEVLTGGRCSVRARMSNSGGIIVRTSGHADIDAYVMNSWDSTDMNTIRIEGGAWGDMNSSMLRNDSLLAGATGISCSGQLRGSGLEVSKYEIGINCSGEIALLGGGISDCTTGIIANGTGFVGPTNYSGNTTDEVIGGTVVRYRKLTGSATYDPPNLVSAATQQTVVTVTGAVVTDMAHASFSIANAGISWTAEVTAANTVTVTMRNVSAGAIDLGSGTLYVTVDKR